MTNSPLANLAKRIGRATAKHGPEILIGAGLVGMVSTTVLAVKATPKALRLIEEAKETEDKDTLTPIETVKVAWKPYIPAAITGITSAACFIGANSIKSSRNAALLAAYKLSESALVEYREKVVETLGEKKEKAVREKIAESHLEKNPVTETRIFTTSKGNTRCFEPLSGRYFYSDIDKIRGAAVNLNEMMQNDPFGYASLNDWYDELELEQTSRGDELGWNVSKGILKVEFHSKLDSEGTPCIVIDYVTAPSYDYSRFA